MSKKRFITKHKFLHFIPNEEDIVLCYNRSLNMGILPGSYTKGAGNMVGCLGEVAVEKYLRNAEYVGDQKFDYDFVYRKKNIEVKSKSCGGLPKGDYSAFINGKKNKLDKNDVHFFTRIKRDLSVVYLLGWLDNNTIRQKATYRLKGDTDPDGYTFKSAGYQLLIKDLNKPSLIKKV